MPLSCDRCGARPPLCDSCVDQHLSWLAGTAGARGYAWAQQVVAQIGKDRSRWTPWPAFADKARAIALAKIAGLSDDARVNEALAQRCHAEAAHLYERHRALRGA